MAGLKGRPPEKLQFDPHLEVIACDPGYYRMGEQNANQKPRGM